MSDGRRDFTEYGKAWSAPLVSDGGVPASTRVIPSRPELVADLTAAIDKAKTMFENRVSVVRIDDLAASITAHKGHWEVSHHREGQWDLFRIDDRGNPSHVNVFATAGKAVGWIASRLTDSAEAFVPAAGTPS